MSVMVGGVNIPDAGLEQPDSPEPDWQGDQIAITRKYLVPATAVKTFLEGLTSGTADALYTDALLRGASTTFVSPQVWRVELRYEPDTWSQVVIAPVGTVTREADANPVEVPVSQSSSSPGAGVIEGAVANGIEAVLVPMPIYRRTEVKSSFTWNETNIIANVGKLNDSALNLPEGMTSPSDEAWLCTEHRVTERSGVVEEMEGWQYNPTGWYPGLYVVAT